MTEQSDMRTTLAAGVLPTDSKLIYEVPTGREVGCYVIFSNNSEATPTTVNLHIDAAAFPKQRRIGKDTVVPAAGVYELLNPIYLGPGDKLWADSAAAVDYIVTGKIELVTP